MNQIKVVLLYRAPFMHDGSIVDFQEVIAFYESGGLERPSRSDHIMSFTLSDSEREELVQFLNSLTADNTDINLPILPN